MKMRASAEVGTVNRCRSSWTERSYAGLESVGLFPMTGRNVNFKVAIQGLGRKRKGTWKTKNEISRKDD